MVAEMKDGLKECEKQKLKLRLCLPNRVKLKGRLAYGIAN